MFNCLAAFEFLMRSTGEGNIVTSLHDSQEDHLQASASSNSSQRVDLRLGPESLKPEALQFGLLVAQRNMSDLPVCVRRCRVHLMRPGDRGGIEMRERLNRWNPMATEMNQRRG